MVIARIATGFALLAALTACGNDGSTDGGLRAGGADPDGSTFVVTGVTEGGLPYELVDGTEIRLRFTKGRLAVQAGCNSMSGGYTVDGTRLIVDPLAMTEMGCEKSRMEQDSWLAGLFERPVQFSAGTDAAIISGSTVLSLEDRKTVSPDVPLAGTAWVLDGTIDGDVASSVPAGVRPPTLRITRAGQAQVFDGCNSGGGPATVSGTTIDFAPRSTTRVACPGSSLDGFVNQVLDGPATYSIEERSLTIRNGDRGLTFGAPAR